MNLSVPMLTIVVVDIVCCGRGVPKQQHTKCSRRLVSIFVLSTSLIYISVLLLILNVVVVDIDRCRPGAPTLRYT